MHKIVVVFFAVAFIAGCAQIPLKDGGVAIGKDTTATVEDVGVARVTNQF